jgi:uncharacterized protein YlxW (UPF0749 family)
MTRKDKIQTLIAMFVALVAAFMLGWQIAKGTWIARLRQQEHANAVLRDANTDLRAANLKLQAADENLKAAATELRKAKATSQ